MLTNISAPAKATKTVASVLPSRGAVRPAPLAVNPASLAKGVFAKPKVANPFPVPAAYQTMISTLFNRLGTNLANYDKTDNNVRQDYTRSVAQNGLNRVEGSKGLDVSMGDRGLTRSGINIDQHAKMYKGYDDQMAGYAQTQASSLANTAQKRLADQAQYNVDRAKVLQQAAAAQAASKTKLAGG